MFISHDGIKHKNCEFYLLILICATFTYSFIRNLRLTPLYVNQLDNFGQYLEAPLKCQQQSSSNTQFKPNLSRINNTLQLEQLPDCLIEEEGLKCFDHNIKYDSFLDYGHIQLGGKFQPFGCRSLQKVAIVVPYRDRAEQLEKFSLYIHQFLPDQLLEYSLFVIEQSNSGPFNRAKLFNIGVNEINKLDDSICCFVFHDVDLMPRDQRNLYLCTANPRHMSPNLSTLRFQLLYPQLFGGAIALTREHFRSIGGFSNRFTGWGGEDDDIFNRFRAINSTIDRSPLEFGDYYMMKHKKSRPNQTRYKLLESSSDVEDLSAYELVDIIQKPLYTLISVKF